MPHCSACGSEVSDDHNFCPNCGAPLSPQALGSVPPVSTGPPAPIPPPEEKPRTGRKVLVAVIIAIILVAALAVILIPTGSPSQTVTLVSPAGCPLTNSSATVSAPNPNYDVQQVMVFAQSFTALAFNVTAVAQCDSAGYGPAYLLNGLSNSGYWYQVGINWNWPLQSGGYTPGFGFVSEGWAPGGITRSPTSESFSGPVNQGDTIELSLSFSNGQVQASAVDLNTGSTGSTTYPADRGTEFIGSQQQESSLRFSFATQGYFTGLMTEWYHVSANYPAAQDQVTYSENSTAVGSATFGVGEWNVTGGGQTSVFEDTANDGLPVTLGSQLQQFTLGGYTVSADSFEFVTGA